MVKLREIQRTATFSWSPCNEGTWLVTGTIPGVIDAGFSNTMELELWNIDLTDWTPESFELTRPNNTISSDTRFNDISWGCVYDGCKKGIIAGAMENGALNLWDANLICSGANENESLIMQNTTHSGIIKSLDFNTTQTKLLASAGENGEIWIWDMESPTKPYSSGQKSNQLGEIQSIAFNKDEKVPYILATAGDTGITSVWDLRAKKAVVNLQFPGIGGGKKGMSSVIWHPDFATKIITASEEDTLPVILMWDLRNSHAPEKILSGHEAGILYVSWCKQDSGLLLSCGKDNRTLCWDPFSAELIGEFPRSNNWVFRALWSLKNPDVIASASYDGKIIIQTTQTVQNLKTENNADIASNISNADFFDNIPSYTRPYESSLLLKKPPKWLTKKCGASFGFGGKLVTFGNNKVSGLNTVKILNIIEESSIIENANNFEEVLKNNDIKAYCQKKVEETDDLLQKQLWEILFILLHENSRDKFTGFLGFEENEIENNVLQKIKDISLNKEAKETTSNQENEKSTEDLEDLFKKHESDNDFLHLKLSNSEKNIFSHLPPLNEPFSIFNDNDSDLDKIITKSIFLGQFDKAVDLCLQEERLSEALIFSFCGGKECQKRAQRAYFRKHNNTPHIRLLSSIIEGNLWDVVLNTNLKDWKEALVIICTFSKPENFSELCGALGDRINTEFLSKNADLQMRNQAVLCYLMGTKLGKLIDIWVEEFREKETSIFKEAKTNDNSNISPYFIHTKLFQDFIEKIAILKQIVNSNDIEKSINPSTLSLLYKKYNDYAYIMASQRNFTIAQKYLNLLPDNYEDVAMAKERVAKALNHHHYSDSVFKNTNKPQQLLYTPVLPQESVLNSYATNLYTPQNYKPYIQNPGTFNQQTSVYPINNSQKPPQNLPYATASTSSAYVTVTSQQKNTSVWNDAPFVHVPKKPIQIINHVSSPFGQNTSQHDQNNMINKRPDQFSLRIQKHSNIPPPPMTGQKYQGYSAQPMQVNTSGPYNLPCNAQPNNSYPRDSPNISEQSVAGLNVYTTNTHNPYIPVPNTRPAINTIYSKPSPKPMVSPTSNVEQYEPIAKSNQPYGSHTVQTKNLYPQHDSSYINSSQGQNSFPMLQSQYPQVPPKGDHMKTQQNNAHTQNFSSEPNALQGSKYPPGDRSHIPVSLKPIFEGLSSEMERVKQYAPPAFTRQVQDTERRLNILFDHLNDNTSLSNDLLDEMIVLVEAMLAKNYQLALNIHINLITTRMEECGHWMVGVKRLLEMSRSIPE